MAWIQPIILAGGSGMRLWPASRSMYPKQLLPLAGENTMLQETVLRLKGVHELADTVLVICNDTHRFLVAEQLREIGVDALTYVPIGAVHRIANPYAAPVHIIEVQCGDYLGEDDIVRLEDNYGREGTNT